MGTRSSSSCGRLTRILNKRIEVRAYCIPEAKTCASNSRLIWSFDVPSRPSNTEADDGGTACCSLAFQSPYKWKHLIVVSKSTPNQQDKLSYPQWADTSYRSHSLFKPSNLGGEPFDSPSNCSTISWGSWKVFRPSPRVLFYTYVYVVCFNEVNVPVGKDSLA